MNIWSYVILLMAHFLSGYGLITLLRLNLPGVVAKIALSVCLGLGFSSFIPMALEIMGIGINKTSLGVSIFILAFLPVSLAYKSLLTDFRVMKFFSGVKLYEIAIFFAFIYILFPGLFMNFYLPSNPRDFTSGSEVVAEFSVIEGQINNSVFKQDMSTTNNHQKPYSLVGLQIIYKTFVQPIGQVWLGALVVSFFVFFYYYLKELIHPVLAGLLALIMLSSPEIYAYVVLVLFDFPNMVFVTFAFIYFLEYLKAPDYRNNLIASAILFGIATFFRAETLILVFFLLGLGLFWKLINRESLDLGKSIKDFSLFAFPTILVYVVSIEYFIKVFLPTNFDTGSNVNKNLLDLSPLFERLGDMVEKLMFSRSPIEGFSYYGTVLYGEVFWIFLAFVLTEAIFGIRKKAYQNRLALYWLAAFLITWFFIGFTGYLLPLADLGNSTKRAMFKLVPLAFIFVANTDTLKYISEKIYNWEHSKLRSRKVSISHDTQGKQLSVHKRNSSKKR